MFEIVQLAFVSFIISLVGAGLIEPTKYIDKVAEQMVSCMEDKKLFDKNFPVNEADSIIHAERYGEKARGKVEFRSGFVVSIESAMIPSTSYRPYCGDTRSSIEADFKLCGVNIAYDVHYDLEDNKKGDATFLLRYDDVFFRLIVFREHKDKSEVKGTLNYVGTNSGGRGQWDMSIKTHPNLPQIQLIAKTIRSNATFRAPLLNGFPKWNLSLEKCLTESLPKVNYPEINYLA